MNLAQEYSKLSFSDQQEVLTRVGYRIDKYRRSYLTIDCFQPVVHLVFFEALRLDFDLRYHADLFMTEVGGDGCAYLDVRACLEEAEKIASEARSMFREKLETLAGDIIEVEGVRYRRIA